MAIAFVKTIGDGLTMPANTIGARIAGLSAVTMHAWVWHTTDDAGDSANNGACIRAAINGATTGIFMNLDSGGGGTNRKHQVGGRALAADALSSKEMTTNLNLNQWNSCGGVWNYGANTLAPWMNGVSENAGAASFGAATYTNGTPTDLDRISNSNGASIQAVDGKICEIAIWKVALTNGEMIALSKGFSALLVRPQSLVFYAPLWGRATNEPDLVRTTTITKVNTSGNIVFTDHPRIIYPAPYDIRNFSTAVDTPDNWAITVSNTLSTSDGSDTPVNVGKFIDASLLSLDSLILTGTGDTSRSLANAFTFTSETISEMMTDGSIWNYVFARPSIEAEDRSLSTYSPWTELTASFACQAAATASFTSISATPISYAVQTAGATSWS